MNDANLTEAKAALHDLMTGRQVRVVVDQNGERIEYTRAGVDDLRAYIRDLENAAAGGGSVKGPMGVFL